MILAALTIAGAALAIGLVVWVCLDVRKSWAPVDEVCREIEREIARQSSHKGQSNG